MKFDKWFTGHLPKENDILEEIKVEEGKKILLYLPTYGDLCSIDEWAETISELKKEYTIITKVHHGTRYDPKEAHRYALVQDFSDIVLSDEYDVLKLLKIADLVFSDNSGAIFDAILADKNTVLLNIKLDINQSFNSNDDSLEQTVRKEIISVSTKDGLMNVLENDELFEKQKPIRKKINDELYEYTDGSSSERIAKVIADYVVNHHENQEKNYYKDQLVAHINQITLLNHKYARYIEQLKKENRR